MPMLLWLFSVFGGTGDLYLTTSRLFTPAENPKFVERDPCPGGLEGLYNPRARCYRSDGVRFPRAPHLARYHRALSDSKGQPGRNC